MYNFDKLLERKGTDCIKWDMMEKVYGHDVVPLWIADMDFEILPELQDIMVKRASHPTFGYTAASPSFKVFLPLSTTLPIFFLFLSYTSHNSGIIIPPYKYTTYQY